MCILGLNTKEVFSMNKNNVAVVQGTIVFESDRGGMMFILENGKIRKLRNKEGGWPRFFSDSKHVLFGKTNYMYIYDLLTDQIVPLDGVNKYKPYQFDISPDSKKVVFTSEGLKRDDLSNDNLYVANLDGSECKQITFFTKGGKNIGASGASRPRWSPDGLLIAFNGPDEPNRFSGYAIYTIKPDGTGMKKIIGKDKLPGAKDPSWSSDSKKIVFSGWDSLKSPSYAQIFVSHADGSDIIKITKGEFINTTPVFSPDDMQICFVSKRHKGKYGMAAIRGSQLYVINVDGTNEMPVTPPTVVDKSPIGLFGTEPVYATDSEPDWHK